VSGLPRVDRAINMVSMKRPTDSPGSASAAGEQPQATPTPVSKQQGVASPSSNPPRAPGPVPQDRARERAAREPTSTASPKDSAGSVTHDARGNAVWKWAVAVGTQALESTSRLLKRLEVPELSVEDKPKGLELEDTERGGGYDPYNQRKNTRSR